MNEQRALLQRTLGQAPELHRVIETLSFPHWFERTILERLIAEQQLDERAVGAAMDSGLVERWTDGAFAVLDSVRALLRDSGR